MKRTAVLLLSEVAMGETISMALFRAGRRTTTEPLSRAGLERILTDEVRHQRLGWESLAVLLPTLKASLLEALQTEAKNAFVASEVLIALPALRSLEAGAQFDPAWGALGVLPLETRIETFYTAVEQLVVPRLSTIGLDGERAWRERYNGQSCSSTTGQRD